MKRESIGDCRIHHQSLGKIILVGKRSDRDDFGLGSDCNRPERECGFDEVYQINRRRREGEAPRRTCGGRLY